MSDIEPTAPHSAPSTFGSRAAEREARRAAGEPERERRQLTLRAGTDESANVVVTRVRQ
jgi:hypothetical protein